MRTVGLITEYNPFHNGHLHHLRESRLVSSADTAVAVMSGHFLQRGEPALLDKWRRADMALRSGVNLVLELPLPWACNSAPVFAEGGVQCLEKTGVDALCFGSEAGNLEPLRRCSELLDRHRDEIDEETRRLLRQGLTYPAARAEVVASLSEDESLRDILAEPNNILGIEYLRAIRSSGARLTPFTIPRLGPGFHDLGTSGTIASATGIRQRLSEGIDIDSFVPKETLGILQEAVSKGEIPDDNILLRLLVHTLQQPDLLRFVYQVADGIENRFYSAAQMADKLDDLIVESKARQLTRTRVQRVLTYVLLGLEAGLMSEFLDCGALYLHILGHDELGESFLGGVRKESEIPLIGNYSRVRNVLTRRYGRGSEKLRLAQEMLAWEIRATRTYTLLLKKWPGGNRNLDFFREVVRGK